MRSTGHREYYRVRQQASDSYLAVEDVRTWIRSVRWLAGAEAEDAGCVESLESGTATVEK